jgi:hypothetical protein
MNKAQIEKKIEKIKQELLSIGQMRPGALSRQYAACQKPGCACVDPIKPKKHGPFYQLSYSHQGKSTTRFVRLGYVTIIRKELAAYKRFKKLTQDWVALSIALSQLQLEDARKKEDKK